MKLKAYYTKDLGDPYEGVSFKEISYGDFSFVAPEHWSQVAIDIVVRKYRRKTSLKGLPQGENDIRQIFHRLTLCWSKWAKISGLITKKSDLQTFKDELTYMLVHQMAAPNSPQWFNSGLYEAYGLKGEPHGHFYCEKSKSGKLTVKKSKSSYERPQPHACFIQGLKDDLVAPGGIMDLWMREALVFKFGSGSGTNFSALRGRDEPLASGGTSSGLMGWLKIGDRAAGAIKSGGTTRRAAKMVCLDGDHPEIEDFVRWKADEEERLAAMKLGHEELSKWKELAKKKSLPKDWKKNALSSGIDPAFIEVLSGYESGQLKDDGLAPIDTDWQGSGYESLSGQNANNSVRLGNDFFKCLEEDGDWSLKARTSGAVTKKVKARDLWQLICESAWKSADPGLQFSSTINDWHPCPEAGPIRASNPCSEYMFLDDTACNLASLNIAAFCESGANSSELDVDGLKHAANLWTMVLEVSVSMAQFPSKEIAKKSFEYRTLGLGLANLGAYLMRSALPYDSEEARKEASSIMALIGGQATLTSAKMAEEVGAYERFKEHKKSHLKILKKHWEYAEKLSDNEIANEARNLWKEAIKLSKKSGLRNAQVTAIAPTGTIGLVMDCDTTGIEPDYSLVKEKSLAGGGHYQLVNQSVEGALKKLGHTSDEAKAIISYILKKNSVVGAPHLKECSYAIFDCAVGAREESEERKISSNGHLLMMAAMQPFISGAISKTINLSQKATVDDVKEIYLKAHKLGLKAVAIYRDGTKMSQPLSSSKETQKEKDEVSLSFLYRPEACPLCHAKKMLRAGSCWVCSECGESTSCG